jgi:hypothetical protein
VAHVPVTADELEEFAKLADAYAALIRKWRDAAAAAIAAGGRPTMNGLQTLKGNLQREIDRAIARVDGQATAIKSKADAAKKRGAAAHAAKPKKTGT